jgi:hypothetical protein
LAKEYIKLISTEYNQDIVNKLRQDFLELDTLEKDFNELDNGLSEISRDYLQDKYLLVFWQQYINFFKNHLLPKNGFKNDDGGTIEPKSHRIFMNDARTYSRVGKQLSEIISNEVKMGLLDEEILSGIGERMVKIDDMAKYLYQEQGDLSKTTTWYVLTLPATYEIRNPVLIIKTGSKLPFQNWF